MQFWKQHSAVQGTDAIRMHATCVISETSFAVTLLLDATNVMLGKIQEFIAYKTKFFPYLFDIVSNTALWQQGDRGEVCGLDKVWHILS